MVKITVIESFALPRISFVYQKKSIYFCNLLFSSPTSLELCIKGFSLLSLKIRHELFQGRRNALSRVLFVDLLDAYALHLVCLR